MEFKNVILGRRSIRRFKQKPINKEILLKLIEAARLAPSAGNIQPLKYLIVTEKDKLISIQQLGSPFITQDASGLKLAGNPCVFQFDSIYHCFDVKFSFFFQKYSVKGC